MVLRLMSKLFASKAKRKQRKFDKTFLDMCVVFSGLSKCVAHQVACLIVKDNRIISSGMNGTPPGYVNCDEKFKKGRPFDKNEHDAFSDAHEIHSEENAILNAAKHGIALDGATAYCTLQPCFPCLEKLYMAGIRRIVYLRAKPHRTDKDKKRDRFARKFGIPFERYKG